MLNTEYLAGTAATLGMELEIQLIDKQTLDLAPRADAILHTLQQSTTARHFKQEVTCSMLELNSSIHDNSATLEAEMLQLGAQLCAAAALLDVRPCGGGTHLFQDWRERRISDFPRYRHFAEHYGYLARQFTVFGQHVHVGCPDGDTAIWLTHALSYYIPHFLALSASSPYLQGEDSGFASSRSNIVRAFPCSGHLPQFVRNWQEFQGHVAELEHAGIISSLKDLYWDIRPKPEYGTVEVRIFDTPLDILHSVALAALVQTLVRYLLDERPPQPGRAALYCVYDFNRFQAARFGLEADIHDVRSGKRIALAPAILDLLQQLSPYASGQHARDCLGRLAQRAHHRHGDYSLLREHAANGLGCPQLVCEAADLWQPVAG
ncbi:YbdK family carboxylate-amine ligase [Vogesella fluminis]|uniref:Putative glutamate--cysteine ligase 2 n=1 Tax=Vogesella fluminis TaxID=1069161 RepID=A0ABQ3H6S6_9NEIS|nr:YbdK family carboxylate-amine ligase [Vogesella fluminis]GHD73551.1 putative glutamate--cysteine ligase 2 [Vogesella fluminis]